MSTHPTPNTHVTRAIPSGVTATDAWKGCVVYESAAGEARLISDITQVPLGVVEDVDVQRGALSVCVRGFTFARPGADITLANQLAASGTKACAEVGGGLVGPTATAFVVGRWDSHGGADPVEDTLYPFIVDIADVAIPEA